MEVLKAFNNHFMEFVEDVANYFNDSLDIQTKGEVSSDWVEAVNGNNDIQIERKYFKMNSIPDVRGMGLKDALLILEDSGLRVKSTGLGKVAFQSLSPGVNFNKGQQIEIILSY